MMGRIVAGLVVIGLAVGVWALWPREEPGPATSTLAPTTTSTSVGPTTTLEETTTSSTNPSETDVIDTVEEAEQVLTDLWFGWFEGIYNQDEERIREVVASQNQLDAARDQFGVIEFLEMPTEGGIEVSGIEILRADADCAAIWASVDVTYRGGASQGLHLLRYWEGAWSFVNLWQFRNDLWEEDCEGQLEPLS